MQYAPTRVHEKFGGFYISAPGCAKKPPSFTPNPSARLFEGRMQYAPTRVRAKFGGFHISASGYAQNPPDFTFPNKDAPKTRQILDPKPCRRTFSGRMQYAPTQIHEKSARFHISAHVPTKNAPDFTLPDKDTPKTHPVLYPNRRRGTFWGRMQYAPIRVRAKFGGFHIFPIEMRPKLARFYIQTVGEAI